MARLTLRTLGTLDLRSEDATPVSGVVAQPKRFAVLTYLAVAGASAGFVRRDTLLALFWPESDADRARNSLRQALFLLRRELGATVLVNRGADEVGVAADQCWCDAVALREALTRGAHEEAVGLYGGDFLAGFNLFGLPEWEQWAAAERDRLRAQAAGAAWALADAAVRARSTAQAVDWARRAAAITPGEEEPFRRLLRLLDGIGDRAAAVQAYDAFAHQLASGWELEPSRETRMLAADIRTRRQAELEPPTAPVAGEGTRPTDAPSAPAASLPAGDATAPALAAGPAPIPAKPDRRVRRRSSWRRRTVAVGAATLTVALALLAAPRWLSHAPGRSPTLAAQGASTSRVAVLPFAVRGTSEWAYLSDGMADLLSAQLDGAGSLRSVDSRAVLGSLELRGGVVDPERGRVVAERHQAELFVLGSVVATPGEQLQLRAALYTVRGGERAPLAEAVVNGRASELPNLIDALTVRLLADRLRDPAEHQERVAAMTTRSLPALKAFLEGERLFQEGEFRSAVDAFQRATIEDSTFALALYRLSTTAERGADPTLVRGAIARAMRYVQRLPHADGLVLRGHAASVRGAVVEAEHLFRSAVSSRPTDAEARTQLGELLFHTGTWRGLPIAASAPAFEGVLALRPTDLNARLHLARLAAHAGHRATLDALTSDSALASLAPAESEQLLELVALRAFSSSDGAARRRALTRLEEAALMQQGYDNPAWLIAWRVAGFLEDPRAGLQIADRLTAPGGPARARLLGLTAGAHMEATRGRWRAARARLAAAEALDPVYTAQVRASLALMPLAPTSARELAWVHAQLARTAGAPRDAVRDRLAAGRDDMRGVRVHYLLGLLALRRGEPVEVARRAEALDSAGRAPSADAELGRHLAHQLRARQRRGVGDLAGALGAVESGWPVGGKRASLPLFQGETYAQASERYLRAELLAALGRPEEALAWYGTVVEDLGASIALLAPVHLRQAELLERLRRPAEAARHYQQFVALWADADAELQPLVTRARQRAAQLSASSAAP